MKKKVFWLIVSFMVLPFFSMILMNSSKALGLIDKESFGMSLMRPSDWSDHTSTLPIVGSTSKLSALLNNIAYPPLLNWTQGTEDSKYTTHYICGFSQIANQLADVNKADLIQTYGNYLYQIRGNVLTISEIFPAKQMKVINEITLPNNLYYSSGEMYVDDNLLVVINTGQRIIKRDFTSQELLKKMYQKENEFSNELDIDFLFPIRYKHSVVNWGSNWEPISHIRFEKNVTVNVFDISDKTNIKTTRTFKLEGNYLDSRKIGDQLYLVVNKPIEFRESYDEHQSPAYLDSAVTDEWQEISFDQIRYMPDHINFNYLMVAGLDLSNPDESTHISTILGYGGHVYASEKHLYVASKDFSDTSVYKFGIQNGTARILSIGSVPGTINNQFSMDEHNGYFRIATTDQSNSLSNNLFVLDDNMKVTGTIDNIAPTEKIYSVHFIGDRAYMVTFREVDPLFVIDLADPHNPAILGQLKTSGYSSYLHPYDENHIIGFGIDTKEETYIDPVYGESSTTTVESGIKITLFDVSDVRNPKQKFVEIIGDQLTDSELLDNHNALLFSKEKNLLSFPVQVYKDLPTTDEFGYSWTDSQFVFGGAYVYTLDLQNGFQLKKKISHDYEQIKRILHVDDTLYTVSDYSIQAHQLGTYQKLGELNLAQ